jgi:uncharacterized protein YraI
MPAMYEMASCFKLIPGLEEEVIARMPVMLAPITIFMAAISLSAWMKMASSSLANRPDMYSGSSF